MLELVFLFFIVPRRMTRLARERNRSALKWSLAAIGVWLAVEIVVTLAVGLLVFVSSFAFGYPKHPESLSPIAYIPALIAALISAEFMTRLLRSKPVVQNTSRL